GEYVEGIARIVAVRAERRDQHRAVDPDLVHCRHHLVAGDLRRPLESADPGAARVVAFIGVNLAIEYRHSFRPSRSRYRAAAMSRFGRSQVKREIEPRCSRIGTWKPMSWWSGLVPRGLPPQSPPTISAPRS